jgi:hypothetical protein
MTDTRHTSTSDPESERTSTSTHTESDRLFMDPEWEFPDDLHDLPLEALQVLHSRVSLQIEGDYQGSPDGPSGVTLDQLEDLERVLRSRESQQGAA